MTGALATIERPTAADWKAAFGPGLGAAELQLLEAYLSCREAPARRRAFEAFLKTGLPTRRVEAFKYTDIRRALSRGIGSGSAAPASPLVLSGDEIVCGPAGWRLPEREVAGVRFFLQEKPGALGGAEDNPMAALAVAVLEQGFHLMIEVTSTPERPLHLVFPASGGIVAARVTVIVRSGASVTVEESHATGAGLALSLIDYGLEDGAKLERNVFQGGSDATVQTVHADINIGKGGAFQQTLLMAGAQLSRSETHVSHRGEASEADLRAAYLAAPGRHADLTSLIRHAAPSCVTRHLTKGAAAKGGSAVFQGKILVPRTVGQFTDADMQHNALLLEHGANVNAKPELEIYADDVECAHGNTMGALDEDALFYMRQRGIPLAQARAMLTEAFLTEALEGHDALAGAAQAMLGALTA